MDSALTEIKTDAAMETREQLLKAAVTVFSQKGFAATRLEDIALESGHTRGAISFHFKNKNTIFKKAFARSVGDMTGKDYEVLLSEGSAAEIMEKMVNLMVDERDMRTKASQIYNLLLTEQPAGMEELIEELGSMFNKLISAHEELLRRGVAEGVFCEDIDAGVESRAFYTWFWGYYANLGRLYSDIDSGRFRDHTHKMFIDRIIR